MLSHMRARCTICPVNCVGIGFCGGIEIRNNSVGRYYSGLKITKRTIEYFGLYHFYPASEIAFIVTSGCNLSCVFCPEYLTIYNPQGYMTIDEVYAKVLSFMEDLNLNIAGFYCNSILDIDLIRRLKHSGKKVVAISHGFFVARHVDTFLALLDAILIRFLGFSEDTYSKVTAIPVGYKYALRLLRRAYEHKLHAEIEFYVIPGITSLEEFTDFLDTVNTINRDIPLHIKRFYPRFLEDRRTPTRTEELMKFYQLAKERLNYVYADLWYPKTNNTYCPEGHLVIERFGWKTRRILLRGNRCPTCGREIPVVVHF